MVISRSLKSFFSSMSIWRSSPVSEFFKMVTLLGKFSDLTLTQTKMDNARGE